MFASSLGLSFTRALSRSLATLPDPKTLLIVYHSRTGFAEQMVTAIAKGARAASEAMESPLVVSRIECRDVTARQVLGADGYCFVCPENLGTASGAMLEFFHSNFYEMLSEDCEGGSQSLVLQRPFAVAIAAGSDGSGAASQIARICRGWRLKEVAKEPLILRNGLVQTKANILMAKGEIDGGQREKCEELGGLVVANVLL